MAKFLSIELPNDERPATLLAIGEIVAFASKKLRALGAPLRMKWQGTKAITCQHGKPIGNCPYGCWQPAAMNRALRRQAPGAQRVPKRPNRTGIEKARS